MENLNNGWVTVTAKKKKTSKKTTTKTGYNTKSKTKTRNNTKKTKKSNVRYTKRLPPLTIKIKRLQKEINKNILYDEYDWTNTFQQKTIDGVKYNHLLGLNNPELMTQNYADLLIFVNKSITNFKSESNTETVKMYLVDGLTDKDKSELKEQEDSYKTKYELETSNPVDLFEGMVKPHKDDTVYFEELDNKFATIRDFLEERRSNLEKCITKEKNDNRINGPNTEYFQHEIASCSALIDKYNDIKDKSNKQALTEFVGEISDTLYFNKVYYELNRETDRDLFTLTLKDIDEIEIQLLKTFIPLYFFDENNNIKLEKLKAFLLEPKNKYFYQQFIYGIMTIRDKYYKFPYNSLNNKTEPNNNIRWFAPHNEMYKSDNKCGDFVYWSLKFNNYFMYLSTFSNAKLFPSRYVLPIDYKYPNYEQLKNNIDESTLPAKIKSIIKEKETFAFAISDYQGQLFNPLDINKLQFVGCLMIKFQKQIERETVNRIWILFYFKNNDSYESNVTGKKYKYVSCNINLFITDNTNITYRQLVSYKELKQYYYYSINPDTNTNTELSFYRYDTTKLQTGSELSEKYKHILLVTRHNDDNEELTRVVSECNLVKVELKMLGETDETFKKEKYKYGITGDIFYLE
jgi:hypothetical protein